MAAKMAKSHKVLSVRLSTRISEKLDMLVEVTGRIKTQLVEEAISQLYDENFALVLAYIERKAPDRDYPPHSRLGYQERTAPDRARPLRSFLQSEQLKKCDSPLAQMIQEFEAIATEKMKEVIEKYKGRLEIEGARGSEVKEESAGKGQDEESNIEGMEEKSPKYRPLLERLKDEALWRFSKDEDK